MTITTDPENSVVTRAPALVRDQVANYLRHQIISMRLRPGAALIEREICEATTASRATVREALRQLESDGLVVSELGRGTYVASLTKDQAADLYEIRARLEGFACHLFAENATAEQVDDLVEATDRLRRTVEDPAAMNEAKSHFYDVLFDGTGNSELSRLVQGLRRRTALLRVNSLGIPGRPATSLKEIEAILDAIVARDADRAEELCVFHITSAAEATFSAPGVYFREP